MPSELMMGAQVASCITVPQGTGRVVLCFGFEQSFDAFPSGRGDPTGAEILIELLKTKFLPRFYPIIISRQKTLDYVARKVHTGTYLDKTSLRFGNSGAYNWLHPDPFEVLKIVGEVEEIAIRYRYYRRLSPSKLRRALIAKVSFWQNLISDFEEVIYVNGNVPHTVDDFIAYRICAHLGHPTVCAYRLPIVPEISARLMFFADPFDQSNPIPLSNISASDMHRRSNDLDAVVAQFAGNGVAVQRDGLMMPCTGSEGGEGRSRRKSKKLFSLGRRAYRSVLRGHGGLGLGQSLSALVSYRRIAKKEIPENFIYFPLHMQPEASSIPLGGVYGDQELLVRAFAEALPLGLSLVVKEHPRQIEPERLLFRYSGFYKRICANNNVFLVHHDVSTSFLLKRSLAAVTLTGTTAFEALAFRKYCFLWGHLRLLVLQMHWRQTPKENYAIT